MTNNISGASFCYALIIFHAVYVLAIVTFYRNEIKEIIVDKFNSVIQTLKRFPVKRIQASEVEPHVPSTAQLNDQNNEQKFPAGQRLLTNKINSLLKLSFQSIESKKALRESSNVKLKKDPSIKTSGSVNSIDRVMQEAVKILAPST